MPTKASEDNVFEFIKTLQGSATARDIQDHFGIRGSRQRQITHQLLEVKHRIAKTGRHFYACSDQAAVGTATCSMPTSNDLGPTASKTATIERKVAVSKEQYTGNGLRVLETDQPSQDGMERDDSQADGMAEGDALPAGSVRPLQGRQEPCGLKDIGFTPDKLLEDYDTKDLTFILGMVSLALDWECRGTANNISFGMSSRPHKDGSVRVPKHWAKGFNFGQHKLDVSGFTWALLSLAQYCEWDRAGHYCGLNELRVKRMVNYFMDLGEEIGRTFESDLRTHLDLVLLNPVKARTSSVIAKVIIKKTAPRKLLATVARPPDEDIPYVASKHARQVANAYQAALVERAEEDGSGPLAPPMTDEEYGAYVARVIADCPDS